MVTAGPSTMRRIFRSWSRLTSYGLHFITAEVLVVEAFQPAPQFVVIHLVGNRSGQFRRFEHGLLHVDGAIQAERQGERVAGARIHADQLAVAVQPDHRVEGIVLELGDHHLAHARAETQQQGLDEVVGHGPRRRDLFDFERDGIRLIYADPDGEHGVAIDVLEDDNGHVGDGIHHKPADFHFDFHIVAALPHPDYTTNYTSDALSPTSELGPARVTRTEMYLPARSFPFVSGSASGCEKLRVRLQVVRPIHWPSA